MKLTKERIVDAGMATFAETGYHGLSMRQVAERLGAHAGSLYYHVHSKDELLALMADRVCRHAYDAGSTALAALPPEATWREEIEVQAAELRRSIQQHPGGALLLADSPGALSTGGLSLMERLLKTLLDAGVPVEHSGIAADTLLSHVTGFVLQEQTEPQTPTVTAETYAALRARFPLVMEQMPRLGQNEKFQRSIKLLCTAFETLMKNDDSRA
ncbi:TetR family transcriptional regulator [Streptomyces inhibens]|uniref:TetR family transcriptional regulator n=1 Tax=Streptomyces inhibens TaxID=2293571 RepID=A0A371Q075_STRIH|nr:TetR family transcriptional regulator [Streptomyces inhibens]REK88100.1 TetR family transcriptional regulator [Streptomyces inhibens]